MSLPTRPARVLTVTDVRASVAAIAAVFARAGFRPDSLLGETVVVEYGNSVTPILLLPLGILPGRIGQLGKFARVMIESHQPSTVVVRLSRTYLANDVVPLVVETMQLAVADLESLGLLTSAGPVIHVKALESYTL